MAFVHPQSCECVKSELDIFIVPPTQTSIESGSTVEYNPIASIADGTPIEFSITGGGQDYIDLSNTELYVKVKVLRADNTPITAHGSSWTDQFATSFVILRSGYFLE